MRRRSARMASSGSCAAAGSASSALATQIEAASLIIDAPGADQRGPGLVEHAGIGDAVTLPAGAVVGLGEAQPIVEDLATDIGVEERHARRAEGIGLAGSAGDLARR